MNAAVRERSLPGGGAATRMSSSALPAATTPTELRFADLYLDSGKFIGSFLGPIVRQVKQITEPLQPVIDVLKTPLPGLKDINDVARDMGYKGSLLPDTLLALIKFFSSGSDFTTLDNLVTLVNFVNHLPGEQSFLIPLGGANARGLQAATVGAGTPGASSTRPIARYALLKGSNYSVPMRPGCPASSSLARSLMGAKYAPRARPASSDQCTTCSRTYDRKSRR